MNPSPRAQILKPTPGNLMLAAEALLRGAPVAMPTETVYGLAGMALDPLALARIFETKERPVFDPLIVHVGAGLRRIEDLDRAGLVDSSRLSREARDAANALMAKFWPGPLTLVLPKNKNVPDLATSGLDTVGIRMPRHPVAQALIAACGAPLAAPSANRFGRISPTCAEDVRQELGERIDFIVDGGACEVGVESTIVKVGEKAELTLLRPGGLSLEEIEGALQGGLKVTHAAKAHGVQAPGMLENHYSPLKPLYLLAGLLHDLERIPSEWKLSGKIGLLALQGSATAAAERFHALSGIAPTCRVLSPGGDLAETAHNLFGTLRALDCSDVSAIVCEPCAIESGLGYAIGDRLRRAAAPKKPDSK